MSPDVPWLETSKADEPASLYAATKKSMELMAHSYAHLFGIPTTAFRFFTVYGPWGRPDMALFRFFEAIAKDEPIEVYGEGKMARDFTYIDDLVEAVVRLADVVPSRDAFDDRGRHALADRALPRRQYRRRPAGRPARVIDVIEKIVGHPVKRKLLPMQPGDVPVTFASAELLAGADRLPALDWPRRGDPAVRRMVSRLGGLMPRGRSVHKAAENAGIIQ